jgi:hypothetical protein
MYKCMRMGEGVYAGEEEIAQPPMFSLLCRVPRYLSVRVNLCHAICHGKARMLS